MIAKKPEGAPDWFQWGLKVRCGVHHDNLSENGVLIGFDFDDYEEPQFFVKKYGDDGGWYSFCEPYEIWIPKEGELVLVCSETDEGEFAFVGKFRSESAIYYHVSYQHDGYLFTSYIKKSCTIAQLNDFYIPGITSGEVLNHDKIPKYEPEEK